MYDVSVSVSYLDTSARKVSVSYLDTKFGEVSVSYRDTIKKYLWTPLQIPVTEYEIYVITIKRPFHIALP